MEWEYLTREEWGANDSLPRLGYGVHPDDRTEIWNHHTVGIDNDATPNIWESRADIIAWQRRMQTIRPDLGNDVPYNFVLYAQPNKLIICEGRGLMRTGAHTRGHNTSGIAGGWHGNFEHYDFDPLPYFSAWGDFLYHAREGTLPAEVEAMALPNLGSIHPPGRDTFGHKDSGAQTACPGKYLYDQLLHLKVKPLVAAPPPPPPPPPPADAWSDIKTIPAKTVVLYEDTNLMVLLGGRTVKELTKGTKLTVTGKFKDSHYLTKWSMDNHKSNGFLVKATIDPATPPVDGEEVDEMEFIRIKGTKEVYAVGAALLTHVVNGKTMEGLTSVKDYHGLIREIDPANELEGHPDRWLVSLPVTYNDGIPEHMGGIYKTR